MGARNEFSGADLNPLAYESEVSVLWRIAWRNAFENRLMKSHFSLQRNGFVLDHGRLKEKLGWTLPSGAWPIGQRSDPDCVFTSVALRYCPLCLEGGYHSYLHQLLELSACPIHHVALQTRCNHCASWIGFLSSPREVFDRPYCCIICHQPLGGVLPELEAHLDFRSAFDSAEIAMRPYAEWWARALEKRRWAVSMGTSYTPPAHLQWCNKNAFIRALATTDGMPIRYLRPSGYPDQPLVVLAWCQRAALGNTGGAFKPRRDWHARTRTPIAVYRCTLRLLETWIEAGVADGFKRMTATDLRLKSQALIEYMRRKRALALMRIQLEWDAGWPVSTEGLPSREARLPDCPKIDMAIFDGRTSRLGWRAVFLAMYASWYELVDTPRLRFEGPTRYPRSDAALIFFHSKVESRRAEEWTDAEILDPDEALFSGSVAFFRIPGLPMNPWKSN